MSKKYMLLLSVVFILSCSVPRKLVQSNDDELLFQVSKTSCMGECPVYTLSIFQNRYMVLKSEANIAPLGEYYGKLNNSQLEKILQLACKKEILSYQQSQNKNTLRDLPTTFYKINVNDTITSIKRYGSNPEAFKILDKELSNLIETSQWKVLKE